MSRLRSIGVEQAIEKRLRSNALTMRITSGLLFAMAIVGGWYLCYIFSDLYREYAEDGTRFYVRKYEMRGIWIALVSGVFIAGVGVTFLMLSWPARRGNGTASLTAGIIAIVLAMMSALFAVLMVVNSIAMTAVTERLWEKALSITMIVLSIVAVPWFTYMMIKGFEGRRTRRRPAAAIAAEAGPIKPVSSGDAPSE